MEPSLFVGVPQVLPTSRIHVVDVTGSGKKLTLRAVNEELAAASGYVIPHSVIATSRGSALITMIGAATATTQPGGIVEIDDRTGA